MTRADLTIAKVAEIAGCHPCTVRRYEQRGFIKSLRDNNSYRRFPRCEAKKLKDILDARYPEKRS